MKKIMLLVMIIAFLVPQFGFTGKADAIEVKLVKKFMKLSPSEYLELKASYKRLPIASITINPAIFAAMRDIRGFLPSFTCDRNQGGTGTCWVWGCTAALEVELNKTRRSMGLANDRISIQYLDSNYVSPSGNCSFCGGNPDKFVNFYNSKKMCIPWSNANASFLDGSDSCSGCPSNIAASSITTSPYYHVSSMSVEQVFNPADSQDVKIDKIRNLIDNNIGVIFGFHWQGSQNFSSTWSSQTETDVWNPVLGNSGQGNGHMVFCFGYNAVGRYWRMLNSWGCNGGNRPNGEFRLPWDSVYGDDHYAWFKLNADLEVPPSITALPATDIKPYGARINSRLNNPGSEATTVRYQFREYDKSYGTTKNIAQFDSSSNTYYIKLLGLTPNKKYNYRFFAKTAHHEVISNEIEFTPIAKAPTLLSPGDKAKSVALAAILSWQSNEKDFKWAQLYLYDSNVRTALPIWHTTQTYPSRTEPPNSITVERGKLERGQTYYWKVREKDSKGNWTLWSTMWSFSTTR